MEMNNFTKKKKMFLSKYDTFVGICFYVLVHICRETFINNQH